MRELQRCEACDMEFIVACGPPGCIPVPACWCADDKRKAEAQAAYERRRCRWHEGNSQRCVHVASLDADFCEVHQSTRLSHATVVPSRKAGLNPTPGVPSRGRVPRGGER